MELTQEEMTKACEIAAQVVLARQDQFKPPKATAIKNEQAWCCEQVFRGAAGDELVCRVKLQWNFMSGGCVQRICQYVDARLRTIHKDGQRYLRLVGLHKTEWSREPDQKHLCLKCGPGFQQEVMALQDSSLHDY
jgi:hypothetical protein